MTQQTTPATDISIRLLAFAHAGSLLGGQEHELSLSAKELYSEDEIRSALSANFPAIAEILPSCRLAHHHNFVSDELSLKHGDELAIIPPVSGG